MTVRGFDGVIGNPPWVLYAGKGKQPIHPAEEALLKELYGRAGRTLSTHGSFAMLAARLAHAGGRVGLVLPTSLADASRYRDARGAHDALCEAENDLPDFGEDAFAGVFQPCMALISTRRVSELPEDDPEGNAWRLSRPGIATPVKRLLAKLDALPKVPPGLFGERGFRSSKADEGKFIKSARPTPSYTAPLYEGTSVREFQLLAPTAFADPRLLNEVTRAEKWRHVDVFIRQTARYPIAGPSARAAFRNSILAGFANPPWTAGALLAYLNSAPIRWYHFHKQRDAQQGMPQVKVVHLRMLPAIEPAALEELAEIGNRVACRNDGIAPEERVSLDTAVGRALSLTDAQLTFVRDWHDRNPPPVGRVALAAGRVADSA